MLNAIKTLIKKSSFLTICFDFFIKKTGFNFEKEYILASEKIIGKNPIVLDIGAHYGESIKNFLKINSSCHIYSFEANPFLAERITKKFQKNEKIKILNLAISDCSITKKLALYVPIVFNYKFTGLSSLIEKNVHDRIRSYFNFSSYRIEKLECPVEKLDDLKFLKKVDLLKVDTEGTELNVFKSGIAIINKFRPLIFFEYSNINFANIKEYFNRINYSLYIIIQKKLIKLNCKIEKKIAIETNLRNIICIDDNDDEIKDLINKTLN